MVNLDAYKSIQSQLNGAQLVAVSKFKTQSDILALFAAGHRDFGENYVQELVDKYNALPKDIRWHFIGHLQRNKVKYIVPFIELIHSIDSFKLLLEVNKEAQKVDRKVDVLLQIYVGEESTKYGLDETELIEFLEYYSAQKEALSNIRIVGLMGMTTLTEDKFIIEREFKAMKDLFEIVKIQYFLGDHSFSVLSMGMSGDYQIALTQGSNMVRIGSTIFGNRINTQ